jgi:hypothetical protein
VGEEQNACEGRNQLVPCSHSLETLGRVLPLPVTGAEDLMGAESGLPGGGGGAQPPIAQIPHFSKKKKKKKKLGLSLKGDPQAYGYSYLLSNPSQNKALGLWQSRLFDRHSLKVLQC